MKVVTCFISVCALVMIARLLIAEAAGKISAAKTAMMAMTTSNSISVKATRATFPGALVFVISCRGSALAQFLLHSFAQPLLDHALIIQVARPGEPLDARQHAWVN